MQQLYIHIHQQFTSHHISVYIYTFDAWC